MNHRLLYNEPMSNKPWILFGIGVFVLLAVVFVSYNYEYRSRDVFASPQPLPGTAMTPGDETTPTMKPTKTGLANPASVNCADKGGTLIIQKRADGGEYGLCMFEDAYACEEWALFRGDCPVGGVRTTGYDTVAQKYCAWSGGQTFAEPNASCTFSDGSTCTDEALFNGACQKGDNPASK